MSGHQDNDGVGVDRQRSLEHLDTREVTHHEIGQDQVDRVVLNMAQGGFRIGQGDDIVVLCRQGFLYDTAYIFLVIDDQNMRGRFTEHRCPQSM